MILFPAIDLFAKKAVRLLKGDYDDMTVYSDQPLYVAKDFKSKGATHIHLVDLQGAKDGTTPNFDVVKEIAQKTSLFTEIGGGIRNIETVDRYIDCGVNRVILGTAAVNDLAFLKAAVLKYGKKIAVGADVKDGYMAIKGWTKKSDITLEAFFKSMQDIGVENIICTDISKDGAMEGSNLELYRYLSFAFQMKLTASGGICTLNDVKKLREMNLYGAIIGKAYYTGAIDLAQAIEVAK